MTEKDLKQDDPSSNPNSPPAQSVIEPIAFTPHRTQVNKRRWQPSRQQWLIGTPLVLGLLIVVFLLTSRSVSIVTIPANAQYDISGGLHFKLANAWLLFNGQYQLDLEHPGYQPLKTAFTVTDDAEQQFVFEMDKMPGRLAIKLNNADISADVFIDDQPVGTTDTEIGQLSPGHHTLKLSHPRYLSHTESLTIEGLDKLQTLEITLNPAWANVQINTEPAGATLAIGETELGTTPGNFAILEGEQQLSLRLAGYKIWQDNFEFQAGEVIDMPLIKLQKSDGVIQLQSQPKGASVTVNGSFLGQTPLALSLRPNQQHTVKLFKEGYVDKQANVSIASGDSKALLISLVPALGKVALSSDIDNAELYVDGRLMGRPNQTLELPARPHVIRVEKAGFEPFEAEVTPKPELAQQLKIRLRTLDQAKWDKIPARIKTVTGQQLTLFKPNAQFTMGSSRREQGRRSNESLKSVSLTRAFYVSPLLVSNSDFVQYEKFHSSNHVNGNSLFGNDQPVVNVTWEQAAKYCNWLSAKQKLPAFYQEADGKIIGFNADATGYRLLTEAEWAWLARVQGKDGLRKYPWGDQLPPPKNAGNYGDRSAAALLGIVLLDYNDGYPVTSPVGKFAANDKGLYDMGGNAAEWVHDFYSVGTGLSLKTETDSLGPEKGDYHVIRGSSWAHGGITELRLAFRDYSAEKRNDVGFRVARFVEAKKP
ncbi:PEGA domain-containing protein [Simiduia curdlanivorans]|uniref:PEGA domain-containing protein n=1 Tax=Simiduia curdlanivorans TaxID=1492769 RepID=A0ABV8V4H5_9GAMM|nr:PEGA domain-containing protein [Simiduia curdlanivorans]MDN3640252.1 PEGA domain-containing protein [Simiduia curdlanivorans]